MSDKCTMPGDAVRRIASRRKAAFLALRSTRWMVAPGVSANAQASALRDSLLGNANFARLARVGFALRSGQLTVAADAQIRLKAGLDEQSEKLVSAGAEYRLLGILPLRVGASTDFAGATMLSAGTGLQLLGINLDASIANISGTTRPGVRLGFGIGLIW